METQCPNCDTRGAGISSGATVRPLLATNNWQTAFHLRNPRDEDFAPNNNRGGVTQPQAIAASRSTFEARRAKISVRTTVKLLLVKTIGASVSTCEARGTGVSPGLDQTRLRSHGNEGRLTARREKIDRRRYNQTQTQSPPSEARLSARR